MYYIFRKSTCRLIVYYYKYKNYKTCKKALSILIDFMFYINNIIKINLV